jgi:hypothetical protein
VTVERIGARSGMYRCTSVYLCSYRMARGEGQWNGSVPALRQTIGACITMCFAHKEVIRVRPFIVYLVVMRAAVAGASSVQKV